MPRTVVRRDSCIAVDARKYIAMKRCQSMCMLDYYTGLAFQSEVFMKPVVPGAQLLVINHKECSRDNISDDGPAHRQPKTNGKLHLWSVEYMVRIWDSKDISIKIGSTAEDPNINPQDNLSMFSRWFSEGDLVARDRVATEVTWSIGTGLARYCGLGNQCLTLCC